MMQYLLRVECLVLHHITWSMTDHDHDSWIMNHDTTVQYHTEYCLFNSYSSTVQSVVSTISILYYYYMILCHAVLCRTKVVFYFCNAQLYNTVSCGIMYSTWVVHLDGLFKAPMVQPWRVDPLPFVKLQWDTKLLPQSKFKLGRGIYCYSRTSCSLFLTATRAIGCGRGVSPSHQTRDMKWTSWLTRSSNPRWLPGIFAKLLKSLKDMKYLTGSVLT